MRQTDRKIYLASKSPRRRELLRQIDIDFELLFLGSKDPKNTDVVNEDVLPGELPQDYVRRISKEKADFAWHSLEQRRLLPRPVLTADTTVVLDNSILGKPQNKNEAATMLHKLSGKTHKVLTCVTIRKNDQLLQELQESEVTFAVLSDEIINHYCDTLEPYDKAGAYGIQGLAAKFITHISGSYSGIVGLPLYETTKLLREAGVDIP
ncbi:Maf family nucleotide pyrophosphatase [Oxalobacter vibrioformis]|uniref:dTTP/UTP pyrophosphatase n=1 Tax=Oxalobacter vibrioformis TaxID=933080 RepID=A0A9E9LZW3_9BURK|nr:Maf family protein [Oxalobacter vibrioformis]WAW10582.1 Maf family nucleotide pyrophosphatase [Oxalobacter vibrioformis]